jgi:hypothetical protein
MRLLAGLLFAASVYGAVDKDMQRAIAWERHKERAAARQAQIEKRNPTVTYNKNAADRAAEEPNQVKDPGAGKSAEKPAEKK